MQMEQFAHASLRLRFDAPSMQVVTVQHYKAQVPSRHQGPRSST